MDPMPRDPRFTMRNAAQFAMPQPHPEFAGVSSAALRRVGEWAIPTRKGSEWQRDAYSYNELIGEVGYLHNLTANLVSSANLLVVEQWWDPEGFNMTESSDERAQRVMAAFVGPQGGQKELKRRAALHLQIAGESYLLGTPVRDTVSRPAGFVWEFVSTEEVRVTGSGKTQVVRRNPTGTGDRDAGFLEVDAFIARLWRPDPRFSHRADSPMRRVLPICRELVVLSEVVDSVAKSRLSSGLLFVPEELSFGPINENEAPDDSDDMDEFIETLMQHMSAPVEDRTSAAGLVPLVMRGAAEFGDKIRLVDLARDLDTSYQSLRDELLRRLAQGLDAPPEIMTGKEKLNHWSSYNVDADLITRHVNPVGEMIAEFITVAYLRPMLIRYEGMSEQEAHKFRVEFDSRMLTARADEGPAATGAWDRMTLSDDAYLRANGFTETDYPEPDERRRRLMEKVLLADPATYGSILLPKLYPELDGKMPPPATGVAPSVPSGEAPAEVTPRAEEGPQEQPSGPAPVSSGAPSAARVDELTEQLARTADDILRRMLEDGENIDRGQFAVVAQMLMENALVAAGSEVQVASVEAAAVADRLGGLFEQAVLQGRLLDKAEVKLAIAGG